MAEARERFLRRLTREQRERAARQTTEGQRVEVDPVRGFTRVVDTETGEVLGGEKDHGLQPTVEQRAAAGRQTRDFSTPGVRDRFIRNLEETDRSVDASGVVRRTRVTSGATSETEGNVPRNVRDRTTRAMRRQSTGGDLEGQAVHTLPNVNVNLPTPNLAGPLLLVFGAILAIVAVSGLSRGVGEGVAS